MLTLPTKWRELIAVCWAATWSNDATHRSLSARLASGAIWSVASALVIQAASLGASILIARILGARGFGELGLLRNTILLLGSLAGPALGSAATRYVAQYRSSDKEAAGRVLRLLLLASVALGLAIAGTGFVKATTIAERLLGAPSLAPSLRYASLVAFPMILGGVQIGALAGMESFRSIMRITSAESGLTLILPTVGAWHSGVEGAVLGYLAAALLALPIKHHSLSRVLVTNGIRLRQQQAGHDFRVLSDFALPSLLIALSMTPAEWFVRVILSRQPSGFVQLGVFTAAQSWAAIIQVIPSRIASRFMLASYQAM